MRVYGYGSAMLIDYESTAQDTKRRLLNLGVTDFSRFIYWPGRGQPLSEMVVALAKTVRERDVRLLVVDSAALACGGDPKDEQVATRYFNALSNLGVSSLTISHLTKDEKDDVHPFGSIYWYNSARLVWNMKGSDDDTNPKHLGLFCRKSNEDRRHKPIGIQMTFSEDGSVHWERESLVSDLTQYLSLRQRIRAALGDGAKSVKHLATDLDASEDSVGRSLRRVAGFQRLERSPDNTFLWGIAGE